MPKYIVFYSYFETPSSIKNIKFFIQNGIFDNLDVNYIIIINGYKCSVSIPNYKNIIIKKRINQGRDFGAWSVGLLSIIETNKIKIDNNTKYIFLNDTVCGPFIPRYVPVNIHWYELFTTLLSDKIKLSGITINYYPWGKFGQKHVQSMAFCVDMIGLNILFDKHILGNSNETYELDTENKRSYIIKYEHGLSKSILDAGFEISALYIADLKKIKTMDIWYNNKYFNSTINPLETMFIKTNRINSDLINKYYESFMPN